MSPQVWNSELDQEYFHLAEKSIPRLAALYPHFKGREIEADLNGNVEKDTPKSQLAFVLAEKAADYGKAPPGRTGVKQSSRASRAE